MAVRMRHASLPEGQDIEVAEISVPSYQRMGWTVVDRQPSTTAEAQGRRRTQKEND
ncbi:hypothetical protein ACFWNI_33465 [Streptomyces sp. NPDC058377]|uniref:hypothetical protein n=1 Tax=Streptomyces sp. NPDC058377 TaxID=3346468 RepID=UPI003649B91E